MMEEGKGMCKTCKCPHHKVPALCVVLFGLLFLLAAFDAVSAHTVSVVWPILVIIGGLTKLTGSGCKCC